MYFLFIFIHVKMVRVLFLVLGILVACQDNSTRVKHPPSVKTLEVNVEALNSHHSFTGKIIAQSDILLRFKRTGKLQRILVRAGEPVKARQRLAQLEGVDQPLIVKSHRSTCTSSKARRPAKKRYLCVHKNDPHTYLISPQAGIVTDILAQPGQIVIAGQAVIKLAKDKFKAVEVILPKARLKGIRPGQKASIFLQKAPQAIYKGFVRDISPMQNYADNFFKIHIVLNHSDEQLKLDMPVEAIIEESEKQQGAYIPKSALVLDNFLPFVWLIDSTTKSARLQGVTILHTSALAENYVFVSGLKNKDHIVVNAAAQ